ncbi:C40 family peptidase [Nonomuraea rhodomycinica]|uniref:C40 family peptidase n=1 Tax=Nonomuraea rhodomycinica TaxID=1712872 RepID=A0A7Y6IN25_9ACTN|nr:C40 family peptidase [Nonomuraea rhodomycinica]NUW41287.1 C40 family peptidase [Nonomuraea rhodomycinica]
MPAVLGKIAVSAALASAVLVVTPGAAVAEPSPAQVRAKLQKLNERADQTVERYNQATEAYKKAKERHDGLDAELTRKNAQATELRRQLMSAVVSDYRSGPLPGWGGVVADGDPRAVLGGMATLDRIAETRAARLRAFQAATKDLRDRYGEARRVLDETEAARDKVRGERAKVEKLIAEQTRLLRRIGAFRTGDPRSTGMTYSGPASGNARVALQFAFAQIGKPYRFGGTGPGSYDCSGLTQAAWRAAGVSLPRTTWTQWSWGAARRVPLNALQPGDLVFSKGLGHMGMYAGDGKMVHAPQTGDVIKISELDGYWRGRLVGAIRP